MTNTQLYLAIGIPSFLVLLNTGVMVALFGNLSGRIDSAKSELIARIDRVADRLHEIQLTLGRHDARLDALERERKG